MSENADRFLRTDPLAVIVTGADRLKKLILPLIAAVIAVNADGDMPRAVVIFSPVIVLAIPLIAAALTWWFLRYRIGPRDIRVESGIVAREARSVPYERIQDVSIGETLVSRMFGLVSVTFETGAGGKEEIVLAYVSEAEGARLRELVRERRGETDAGFNEAPAAPSDTAPVFAMGLPRVLEFGLYEFSLVIFAVLVGVLGQLDFLLPFNPWDGAIWESLLREQGARVAALGAAAQVASIVLALVGLFVIGLATGVLRTLLRDYGFRLDRTAKGFRRRRGLLTRSDLVMPVHRVQAALVETGLVRRRMGGWHGLKFVSLASDGAKTPNHAIAPFAQLSEIEPIVRIAGIALPTGAEQWHASVGRYWFDRAALTALLLALPALALLAAGEPVWALAPVALAAANGLSCALEHRSYRHAQGTHALYVRSGVLKPTLTAAPRVKLHSVQVAQSCLARWRGYATVRFGLAGGSLHVVGLPPDRAERLAATVLADILSVDFSAISAAQPST